MRFVVYKDSAGDFRWRLVAPNGRTVADSGEGYRNKSDCLDGVQLVKAQARRARVEDGTQASTYGRSQ